MCLGKGPVRFIYVLMKVFGFYKLIFLDATEEVIMLCPVCCCILSKLLNFLFVLTAFLAATFIVSVVLFVEAWFVLLAPNKFFFSLLFAFSCYCASISNSNAFLTLLVADEGPCAWAKRAPGPGAMRAVFSKTVEPMLST